MSWPVHGISARLGISTWIGVFGAVARRQELRRRADHHRSGFRAGGDRKRARRRRFLADLVDRGLQYEDGLLIVIDGAKGLYKAVSTVTIVSLLDRNVSSLDRSGIAYTVLDQSNKSFPYWGFLHGSMQFEV